MSNGNSFGGDGTLGMDDRKAATLAQPFGWGQPIPDMRLMGQR